MSISFVKRLPDKFVQNVTDLCGKEGVEWLELLSHIIEELELKWYFAVEDHFPNLSYNFVASCRDQNENVRCLEIALPLRNTEIFREVKTLDTFREHGGVQVLRLDEERKAVLLERLVPGKNLKELFEQNKDDAIEPAIRILTRLTATPSEHAEFPSSGVSFEAK